MDLTKIVAIIKIIACVVVKLTKRKKNETSDNE